MEDLRSQFVTLKPGQHPKYLPYAFTEQGVVMLSSVLHSPRAVAVNIEIMRAFVKLRQMLASNAELARKLAALEMKYDAQFKVVFEAIRALMTPPEKPRRGVLEISADHALRDFRITDSEIRAELQLARRTKATGLRYVSRIAKIPESHKGRTSRRLQVRDTTGKDVCATMRRGMFLGWRAGNCFYMHVPVDFRFV
jgi:hypothetical protein